MQEKVACPNAVHSNCIRFQQCCCSMCDYDRSTSAESAEYQKAIERLGTIVETMDNQVDVVHQIDTFLTTTHPNPLLEPIERRSIRRCNRRRQKQTKTCFIHNAFVVSKTMLLFFQRKNGNFNDSFTRSFSRRFDLTTQHRVKGK